MAMQLPSGKDTAREPRALVLIALALNLVAGREQPQKRNMRPGQRTAGSPRGPGGGGVQGPTPHHVVGVGDVYARAVRKVKAPVPPGRGLDGVGLVRHGGLRQATEPVEQSCRQDPLSTSGGRSSQMDVASIWEVQQRLGPTMHRPAGGA